MTSIDPWLLSARQLSQNISQRKISSADVVSGFLDRNRKNGAKLNAFVDVFDQDAILAAEAADKAIRSGHAVGPLRGVPIALKDLIDIEGRITAGGSAIWRKRHADRTRDTCAAVDGPGFDYHRQDPDGRVCDGRLGNQQAYGNAMESLGHERCPHAGGRAAAPESRWQPYQIGD
jgi:aspartyl-tRNA(Asn)/glutamyl-tRNA(Gln) amidotransferase subunit A